MKVLLAKLAIVVALVIGGTGAATIAMPPQSAEASVVVCVGYSDGVTVCSDGRFIWIFLY